MKLFLPAALLAICALICLSPETRTASAQAVCDIPREQQIHGGTYIDMPSAADRSVLPLQYAGRTLRVYLPDVGDFGVRFVILGSGVPTVEVCFLQGQAFVVLSMDTGRPIARSAQTVYGNQVIDTIILTRRLQDTFYEETPTPTPSRTPAPAATPQSAQSLSPTTAEVAGAVIRPPSTGDAGLH